MARRSRLTRPLYLLALILVAVYGSVGIGTAVGSDDEGGASFSPNLALDLEGGTQLILTPRTDDGSEITSSDINQAIAIIRQRVDGSGVSEAEITSQGGQNIVVAIPGEVDDDTVDLISASAQMRMRAVLGIAGPGAVDPSQVTETPTDDAESPASGEEGDGEATEEPTAEPTPLFEPDDVEGAAFYLADQNGDGVLSTTPATEPTSASDQAWITEQLMYDFYLLDCTNPETLANLADETLDTSLVTCSADGASKYLLGPAELTGLDLDSASMGFKTSAGGAVTNQPVVQMNFTGPGGQKFAEVTGRLMNQASPMNQFAIVLDGLVISSASVDEVIPNGQATISRPASDPFSRAEATTLANQLNFGSLPLTFEVQSQEQISATLGAEQLQRGILAGIIGLGLVVLYSFLQYRGLGIVSVASLVIAAALTYGVILLLSWTQGYRLSLAGVTGLIVAIGITADSFIVYFERIRDEVREGRTLTSAVEHGWVRARRTIIASDAVNFIAAIVLYLLAVGGVRGFAFTLGLTTLIDLLVVFLFTHPLMRLLIKTRFFGGGHRLSGLDPEHLGASVATYVGRGRVRTAPERQALAAGADTRTIAERRAEAARAEAARAEAAGSAQPQRSAVALADAPQDAGQSAGQDVSRDSEVTPVELRGDLQDAVPGHDPRGDDGAAADSPSQPADDAEKEGKR